MAKLVNSDIHILWLSADEDVINYHICNVVTGYRWDWGTFPEISWRGTPASGA